MHRSGPQHDNADALSRLPCTKCGLKEAGVEKDTLNMEPEQEAQGVSTILTTWIPSWTPEEIQHLQASDSALWPSGCQQTHCQTNFQKEFTAVFKHSTISGAKNGILYLHWEDVSGKGLNKRLQLVLPKERLLK